MVFPVTEQPKPNDELRLTADDGIPPASDAKLRAGHRARLRNRFLDNGPDALQDYELLELLLFAGIPRRDVKPLAKQLISHYGSLASVFSAPASSLKARGLPDGAVCSIKAATAAAQALLRETVMDQPVISSWRALLDYLRAVMAHEKREQFRLLFLDNKNRLIADEVQSEGTINHTAVYPREVARRALDLHATAVILAHNHPSGDPKPSREDIRMTKELASALGSLGIAVHDHVILAKGGHASFKTLGLL